MPLFNFRDLLPCPRYCNEIFFSKHVRMNLRKRIDLLFYGLKIGDEFSFRTFIHYRSVPTK